MGRMNFLFVQKIAVSLGIVIVLNLLFNIAVATFYNSPKYEDFCREEQRRYYDNKQACEQVGGEWGAYIDGPPGPYYLRSVPAKAPIDGDEVSDAPKEYCNPAKTCQKDYDSARNLYNRNVFIVLVSLGAISIILSIFFIQVRAVSSGFLFGGLLSILIGTTRYWSNMNEYLRLIVLMIVLAGLVWVGYKKLKDGKKIC